MQTETYENPGQELDRKAKTYAREHRVSYAEALREVGAEDPSLLRAYATDESELDRKVRKGAAEFSRRVVAYQDEWNLSRDEAARRVREHDPAMRYQRPEGQTALAALAVLIAGLPRNSNASINADTAVRTINGDPDFRALLQKACGEELTALTNAEINKTASPGAQSENFNRLFPEVARQNPALNAGYNGARATPEMLEELLPQYFK